MKLLEVLSKDVLSKIPQLPQRQDATSDQLRDLIDVANKLGMYDAADVLRTMSNRHGKG